MDFLDNIVITDICSVTSEPNKTAGNRMKPHVDYITEPRELTRHEIWHSRRETMVTFNGKKLHIKPGYVTLLPKKLVSEYYADRISLDGGFVDVFFDVASTMPSDILTFDLSDNLKINKLFDKIYLVWIMRDKSSRTKCFSLLYQIFSEISGALSKPLYTSIQARGKIKPAIKYINDHCFDQDFNYSKPAELCGVSYSYFKRIFISIYKMPPSKYITHMRMEQAKEMLQTGRFNVSSIAAALGYNDPAYFSRAFKEYTGLSPLAYKTRML